MECYRCGTWDGQKCDCKDGQTIFHGDCRELLSEMPKVDLVLTDPPYGIGMARSQVRQKWKCEKKDWDDQRPTRQTIALVIGLSPYVIIWGGNYFELPISRKFLVWDKQQPANFSLSQCEQAWCSWDGNAKIYTKRVVGGRKFHHPTQKPEGLIRWCIQQVPDHAATVLDPFLGSGTTLVACKDMGKQGIGIELEEKYCEVAANRLRQEVLAFS